LGPIDRNQSPFGVAERKLWQRVAPTNCCYDSGNESRHAETVGSTRRNHSGHFHFWGAFEEYVDLDDDLVT